MRVKLSYTVEEEDILSEAAKILNMSADDMQQALDLFKHIPQELKGTAPAVPDGPPVFPQPPPPESEIPNTLKILNMIEEYRQCLLSLDTRFAEVVGIIEGYDKHVRTVATTTAALSHGNPDVSPQDEGIK
jgi:hypothetical protein